MRKYFYRLMTDQDKSPAAGIVQWGLHGLSLVYRFGVQTILWFYKTGLLKKKRLSKPVISIGNIAWGGTGKTPLVEWLLKYLKTKKIKPAVLIRGYMMRKSLSFPTKTFGGDSSGISSHSLSDEAFLLRQSFPDVPVLVGRNRIKNAQQALKEHPIDVFVLDDGFQHWKLDRDLDIAVIDCMNPFGNGCLIPRGILREPLKSLTRADLFVLTKTDWGKENIAFIKKKLHSINADAPIIETVHRAAALLDLGDPSIKESLEFLQGKTVAAFCAIGHPDSFIRLLKSLGAQVVVFKAFGDHHLYGQEDVLSLLDSCREKNVHTLVTTQKDAVKLGAFLQLFKKLSPPTKTFGGDSFRINLTDGLRLFSLNMEIQITKGLEEFCGRISRLLDC